MNSAPADPSIGLTPALAHIVGLACGRGRTDDRLSKLVIDFRYGGAAYFHDGKRGRIGKGKVSFDASEVVPQIPGTVLARVAPVVAPANLELIEVGKATYELAMSFVRRQEQYAELRKLLQPGRDHTTFEIPPAIFRDRGELRTAFLVGLGQVCGLASAGTNLFGSREVVWLRPSTSNRVLFRQVVSLLEGYQIPVWWNERDQRDVSVKVTCEDWQRIAGFEVAWLDAIVAEGARINAERGAASRSPIRRTPTQAASRLSDPPDVDPSAAKAGSLVQVSEDGGLTNYGIGAPGQAFPGGTIVVSADSPVGKALIGSHAGDRVRVEAPRGSYEFKVLRVTRL